MNVNALNYRLDSKAIRFILEHANSKVLITDREFSSVVGPALREMSHPPLVIDIDDPMYDDAQSDSVLLGEKNYEQFLDEGDDNDTFDPLTDEWQALADRLNDAKIDFLVPPHIRFRGQVGEQGTLFIADPSGNALEFKGFKNLNQLFAC